MKKNSFVLYTKLNHVLQEMSNEEKGILFQAIMDYQITGEVPDLPREIKLIFLTVKSDMDDNEQKYAEVVEKRREAGKKSAQVKSANANTSQQNEQVSANPTDMKCNDMKCNEVINKEKIYKKEISRFQPPTLEEVSSYCSERNKGVDPNKFIDFYQSKGWMVGKNKMKDWKACVRTWEKRELKASDYEEILPTYEDELPDWVTPEMREEWRRMQTS